MIQIRTSIIIAAYHLSSIGIIQELLNKGLAAEEIEPDLFQHCLLQRNFSFFEWLVPIYLDYKKRHYLPFENIWILGGEDILNYLLTKHNNSPSCIELGLRNACTYGAFKIFTMLVKASDSTQINFNELLKLSCLAKPCDPALSIALMEDDIHVNEHLQIVKYLVENGADIHADNEAALRSACSAQNINLEIIKYLVTARPLGE